MEVLQPASTLTSHKLNAKVSTDNAKVSTDNGDATTLEN